MRIQLRIRRIPDIVRKYTQPALCGDSAPNIRVRIPSGRLISVIVPLRELAWGALLASGISASLLWIFLVSPMMGPAIQDLKAPIHTALGLSVVSALLLSALHRRLSRP